MTADHSRVKEIFYSAAELSPPERKRLLDATCDAASELRSEVESLLEYHDDERPMLLPLAPFAPGTDRAETAELSPGEIVDDRYQIVSNLGSGAMARVYRATDQLLDVEVALKVLRFTGGIHRGRLLEEVRLARRVNHPSVCRVFDVGEHDDHFFLTMELVEGEDLSQLISRESPLPSARVIEIGCEMLEGLWASHDAGVLHCDLKPSNILIDGSGTVRIADFGIGASVRAAIGDRLTGGSPAYMAYEIIDGGIATERTDLYGVGLVLYELTTGRRAFDGPTTDALFDAVRSGTISPPSVFVDDVDPLLEEVILAALERQVARRPDSAWSMWLQLANPVPRAQELGTGAAEGRDRADLRRPAPVVQPSMSVPPGMSLPPGRSATVMPAAPSARRPRARRSRALR